MINELKVFYKGEKGLMTFDNKKTIFQHRQERAGAEEGLGILINNNLFDKGNYAFAIFKNVPTVVPTSYNTLNFFYNKGVPIKIEKGYYGKNVLLKEYYIDKTYIRAYKEDGSVGLYESENIKNENYDGPNVYFKRINDLVTDWVDITDKILNDVLKSIHNLSCSVGLDNEVIADALKNLTKNNIFILESGVIVADGKFESLIIWTEGSDVKMCWLGRKLELDNFNFTKVVPDLDI